VGVLSEERRGVLGAEGGGYGWGGVRKRKGAVERRLPKEEGPSGVRGGQGFFPSFYLFPNKKKNLDTQRLHA
jgi:hypothetical protein